MVSSTLAEIVFVSPVVMRVLPTITLGGSHWVTDGFAANYAVSAIAAYQGGYAGNVYYAGATALSGMTPGRGAALSAQAAGAFVEFVAEL